MDNYCHIPIQLMLAKYDTSFFTKDQRVHSDLHHDNSMIILKNMFFLLVVSLYARAVLVSRLRSSRDSDSQVKSGCSHLIRDVLTLYLGF